MSLTYPLPYFANYWRELLVAQAPDLPTDRLIAWITEETGGNPAGLGSLLEVGIFQIDFQDHATGEQFGASVQTLHGAFTATRASQTRNRQLTDAEELLQVTSGIAYVRQCLAFARTVVAGQGWSDADTWAMCKMRHALPAVCTDLWKQAVAANHVSSWSDFAGYCSSLSQADLPASIRPYHYKLAAKIFPNAGKVGAAAGATPDGSGGSVYGIVGLDLVTALALGALALAAWFFAR